MDSSAVTHPLGKSEEAFGQEAMSYNAPLEKATRLVSELWFPFDMKLFESVQQKAGEEMANNLISSLLEDIKKDISLYLLCLREFANPNFDQLKDNVRDSACPDYFSDISADDIQRVLKKISAMAIPHRLDQATALQKQRLAEMHVSGVSADAIAGSSGLSSGVVFSCSALRQLGLTLVAWNYPMIFEKVNKTPHSADSLDQELRKYLGFSPTMLGASLVEQWGLSSVYQMVVSGKTTSSPRSGKQADEVDSLRTAASLTKTLAQICQVGEALARATNPSLYSSATSDLDFASVHISKALGPMGVERILSGADQRVRTIGASLASSLSGGINNLKEGLINRSFSLDLIAKNRYLEVFPDDLRNVAEGLYHQIRAEGPVDAYARKFAKEVIPKTIFSALTVYLYDPFEGMLFPSLVLGRHQIINPRPEKLKGLTGTPSAILAAFDLRIPLREEHLMTDGSEVSILASSLGVEPSIGVLYVESPLDGTAYNGDMIKYFKGVRNLLSQCLRIEFGEN